LALYDSPRRAADRQVTFDLRVGREETSLVMAFFHFLLVVGIPVDRDQSFRFVVTGDSVSS
jgi:hypothetical protein